MKKLRIALTKGRLEKKSVELFQKMGIDCDELINKGRRLILNAGDYEVVLAKAADVITYVEHGVCDIGIVGKDTIVENGKSFYEMTDLNLGKCDFALATQKGVDFYDGFNTKRIATKYPNITKAYFEGKGMDVKIIKIEGSVELAPLLNLADGIVDIVETGTTLKENNLEVKETIVPISARLIANKSAYKFKAAQIDKVVNSIASQVEEAL